MKPPQTSLKRLLLTKCCLINHETDRKIPYPVVIHHETKAEKVYQQSENLEIVRLFLQNWFIPAIVRLCNIRFPRRKRFSHRFSHVQKRPNKLTIDSRRGEISTSATSQFQFGRRNRTIRVDSIHNDFEENREKIGSEREEGEKKGGKIDIFFRTRIKRKR